MTQTTSIQTEKQAAMAIFNIGALKDFLYDHAHDVVGNDKAGRETTLIEEVAEVAKMAHKAYVQDGVNYYRSRNAFRQAELTDEQKAENSKRMYMSAAKKLLFLNTVCKLITGSYFIAKRINKDDMEDVESLVDSFEFFVRNYSEF